MNSIIDPLTPTLSLRGRGDQTAGVDSIEKPLTPNPSPQEGEGNQTAGVNSIYDPLTLTLSLRGRGNQTGRGSQSKTEN